MRAIILDWNQVDAGKFYADLHSELKQAIENKSYKIYQIEAKDRNELFEILNIRHPANYRDRSFSVGDIAIENDDRAWVCLPIGWKQLADIDPTLPGFIGVNVM